MTRNDINPRSLRSQIKRAGLSVTLTRIGTGKHFTLGMHGLHADVLADALAAKGMVRTPMSGKGTWANDQITMDLP